MNNKREEKRKIGKEGLIQRERVKNIERKDGKKKTNMKRNIN